MSVLLMMMMMMMMTEKTERCQLSCSARKHPTLLQLTPGEIRVHSHIATEGLGAVPNLCFIPPPKKRTNLTYHFSSHHFFTTRCYAKRGYAAVCRLSVRLTVTFRYRYHIGWNLEFFENNVTAD